MQRKSASVDSGIDKGVSLTAANRTLSRRENVSILFTDVLYYCCKYSTINLMIILPDNNL